MPYYSIAYVLILGSLLYVNLATAQLYGETLFYHPLEHAGLLVYCLVSFFATRYIIRLKRYQDSTNIWQYVEVILLAGALNTLLTTGTWMLLRFLLNDGNWQVNTTSLFANVAFIFFNVHLVIAGGYLAYYYLNQANQAELNRVRAEQASSQAQLKLLQQQLTPHFLFNNLNVLSSLISYSPDSAEVYVSKLANLYRYMLKHKESHFVSVAEEMGFMLDYIDLMNIRFDGAYSLQIKSDIAPHQHKLIAAGSLQTLVENAIKHNTATPELPLEIDLFIAQQHMTLINKKTLKPSKVESTRTGLSNLQQRYQSLTNKEVTVEESEGFFSVSLPLLEQGVI
ncbi:sensor histidine kinase [Shewanella khirikhana]|uniref:Sensor-like histidine kinase n=1 Tax=Shewanella khirikhana TaxID=1965282 RepID=A0ABM7DSA0_9GAMM|nr:histidine kinase [Shewanella khirikhana]AZQ12582.1 putative sensor-like histidine kinase [Shewanella khirikhana]